MKLFINKVLKQECDYLKEIIYSNNVETIENLN